MGNRRRKKSNQYEILIIPQGDGGSTKSLNAGTLKIALWGSVIAMFFFLLYLLAFRYTPLGLLVGLDPAAAAAASQTEIETQRRIAVLAEEVGVLKAYNLQLRKALGERADQTPPTGSAARQPVQQQEDARPQTSAAEEAVPRSAPQQYATVGLDISLPLFAPVRAAISRGFDAAEKHFGVDFPAKQGTPVQAAADGYVVFAGWSYDDGNMLVISHGSSVVTVYKHNASLLRNTGSLVKRGDIISLVGNTGRGTTGPHLHFEVLKDGVPVDPTAVLLNVKTTL